MKAFGLVALATFVIVLSIVCTASAQLQLSYTNADVAEKLVRTGTTTTPVPTTKKSTFFGGIRNLFSSKKETTSVASDDLAPITTPMPPVNGNKVAGVPSTTTSTTTTTTTPKPTTTTATTTTTITSTSVTAAVNPVVPTVPGRTRDPLHDFESYATITLKTTKKPAIKDDFPALPPPRRPAAAAASTATPTAPTPVNAWNTVPSAVNFVPTIRPATPTQVRPAAGAGTTTTTPVPVPGADVTDAELEALTEVLYTKETSLLPLLTLNYQGRTQSSATVDDAPLPLISVNEVSLNANPTVAKMKLLYNNYEQDTAINEHVTAMERNEETDFVDALLGGSLMRHTMQFLQQKDKVTLDPKTHRDLLKTIWFSLYSRGRGKIGSSAFEHVFLTELRNGTVSGFHNWIYYFYEEQAGRANYQGWLKKTELGNKAAVVKYRFSYNGVMKPVNAMFVGTSPELEVALYTLCFAVRADRECPVSLGGQRLKIRTHTFRYRGKNLIGSAFPEI